MGRKTFESIGRPLPNRKNIIISRQSPAEYENIPYWHEDKNVYFVRTKEDALFIADVLSMMMKKRDIFVIGGAEIYKLFGDIFYKVFLTWVFTGIIKGDATFDFEFLPSDWKTLVEREIPKSDDDEYVSRFIVYRKKKYLRRFVDIRKFLKFDPEAEQWLQSYIRNVKYNDRIEGANEVVDVPEHPLFASK